MQNNEELYSEKEALELYKLHIKKALKVHTKCKPTILIKGDTFFLELWQNETCVYKTEIRHLLNEIHHGRSAQRIAFDIKNDFKKEILKKYFRH